MAPLSFLTALKKTLDIFKKNIGAFTLLIFSDVLFVMIFGRFLWSFIAKKLYPMVGDMLIVLNQNTQASPLEVLISSTNVNRRLVAQQQLQGLLMDIAKWVFLLVLGTLVLWIVFQGFDYWWLKKRSKEKFDTRLFVRQFVVDNTFYFMAIFLVAVMFGKLSVLLPLALWQKSMLTLGFLIIAYLVHMAFLSYAYMGKEKHMIRKPFVRGFRWQFIFMWLIVGVFIYMIDLFTRLLFFNQWALLIIGVFIVFTAFNLAKLYVMQTAEAMLEEKKERKK